MIEHQPNPGSREAAEAGCICPIEQNFRGVVPPLDEHWWIDAECPMHGTWVIETEGDIERRNRAEAGRQPANARYSVRPDRRRT